MVTTDLSPHRDRLLTLRARLRLMTTQMADNALKEAKTTRMPNHMAELGTGDYEQELTLGLLISVKNALEHVEAAIARIENGTYGRCDACGRSASPGSKPSPMRSGAPDARRKRKTCETRVAPPSSAKVVWAAGEGLARAGPMLLGSSPGRRGLPSGGRRRPPRRCRAAGRPRCRQPPIRPAIVTDDRLVEREKHQSAVLDQRRREIARA